MRERAVETYLVTKVRALGGVAWKFTSQSQNGVPDRLVILPGGQIWFIELKSPAGVLSKIQAHVGSILKNLGCNYAVLSSKEEVGIWCQNVTSQ